MKHRNFCTWLMICGLFFAVMAGSGCNGSGDTVQIPNTGNTDGTTPTTERIESEEDIAKQQQAEAPVSDDELQAIYENLEAIVAMFESLDAEGTLAKINARGLHIAQVSESGDIWTDVTNEAISVDKAVNLLSNDLRGYYYSGSVIALLSPTEKAVNVLLDALGEENNITFVDKANGENGLEIFAVAKASDDSGQLHTFVYHVPQRDSFTFKAGQPVVISADGSVDNDAVTSGDPDYTEYPYEGTTSADVRKIVRDFNIKRLMAFFRWCADGIDSELAAKEAIAALKAAAAADELTSLAAAHNATVPFSYTQTFKPFGDYDGGRYDRTITREVIGRYHIYSCHSFANGSDFYLVKSTLESTPNTQETNPQRNYTTGDPAFYTDYYAGFTHYLINSAYIQDAGDDTSKVQLIYNLPSDSVPENQTITKTNGWSVGTEVSVGFTADSEGKIGMSAGVKTSKSVSHSDSITYTTQNWKIENLGGLTVPKFRALFRTEADNGEREHHYSVFGDKDHWQQLKIDDAAKNRINYSVEWIWEVKKDFWQNRDSVKIIANPTIGERFAFGWGYCYRPWGSDRGSKNKDNGRGVTVDVTKTADISAPAPAHLYVDHINYNLGSGGGENYFELLCNSDWKVESDSDWCVIGSTASGSDTGVQRRKILFNVGAYPNAGGAYAVRQAVITVTEQLPNNRTGNVAKIYVQQANQ